MTQRHKVQKSLHRAIGPAIAALAVLAMIGYAIFGPTGLYAWGEYGQSVEKRRVILAQLEKQRDELRNRVDLLNKHRVDPDMADEMIRKELGVSHPDDVIIPMAPDVPQ